MQLTKSNKQTCIKDWMEMERQRKGAKLTQNYRRQTQRGFKDLNLNWLFYQTIGEQHMQAR